MSADLLREAAALLRQRATDATPAPFVFLRLPARHVAYYSTVRPGVGVAVAEWLDDVAAAIERIPCGTPIREQDRALTVARAYLVRDS